ncbi:hypothetical protein BOTBODRAFT_359310 [Botryobasidium botryosum FD-172 SS1]|uniref:Uncharacterized protein n=1 Tax=Botryobasidium botryosum (strain FD-172 SS1) TaxID=930990 RepID=A0A067ME74_BOTB1|nr:hypothetical protein BOTBODRAFT_359310 [Botryobasidium botryosum FD-172 SS1]
MVTMKHVKRQRVKDRQTMPTSKVAEHGDPVHGLKQPPLGVDVGAKKREKKPIKLEEEEVGPGKLRKPMTPTSAFWHRVYTIIFQSSPLAALAALLHAPSAPSTADSEAPTREDLATSPPNTLNSLNQRVSHKVPYINASHSRVIRRLPRRSTS